MQTLQHIVHLAAEIKGFEFDGSMVEIHFMPGTYTKDQIQTMLNSIGIKQIIYSNNDTKGGKIEGCSFILDFIHDENQKSAIQQLKYAFVRMKALKDLYNHGGFNLGTEEEKYFNQKIH